VLEYPICYLKYLETALLEFRFGDSGLVQGKVYFSAWCKVVMAGFSRKLGFAPTKFTKIPIIFLSEMSSGKQN
jgi:hypothetical protein